MKKTIFKVGLSALLVANMIVLGEAVTSVDPFVHAASTTKNEVQTEVQKIKGKITNISQKAKTIALAKKDKSFFLVKFSDATVLKGVESSKDFKVGEALVVNYTTAGGENTATSLQKALVKLPEGIKEIKTKELVGLLSSNKDLIVVDARPPIKYSEGHIPGSIFIPYSKLVKLGDEGAKLFDKYKDTQLVFYCGGPT